MKSYGQHFSILVLTFGVMCSFMTATNIHAQPNTIAEAREKLPQLQADIKTAVTSQAEIALAHEAKTINVRDLDNALTDPMDVAGYDPNQEKHRVAYQKHRGFLKKLKEDGFLTKNWNPAWEKKPSKFGPMGIDPIRSGAYEYMREQLQADAGELDKQLEQARRTIQKLNDELVKTNDSIVTAEGDKKLAEQYSKLKKDADDQVKEYIESIRQLPASSAAEWSKRLDDEQNQRVNKASKQMREIVAEMSNMKLSEGMSLEEQVQVRKHRAELIARLKWLSDQHDVFGFPAVDQSVSQQKRDALDKRTKEAVAERMATLLDAARREACIFEYREPYIRLAVDLLKNNLGVDFLKNTDELIDACKKKSNGNHFTQAGKTDKEVDDEIRKGLKSLLANTTANEALSWLENANKGKWPSAGIATQLEKSLKAVGLIKQLADVSLDGMMVMYKGLLIKRNKLIPGKAGYNENDVIYWLKENKVNQKKFAQLIKKENLTAEEMALRIQYEMEIVMGTPVKNTLTQVPNARTKRAYWSNNCP